MKPREAGRSPGTDSTAKREGWPLVGRAPIISRLTRILQSKPAPTGAMISGEAGIGKTRLLFEFADRAADQGWAVESVVGAVSTVGVPMGALAQLLPHGPAGSADPALFLAFVREELLSRHEGERLLLIVDDAPRLDPVSAGFVAQLAVMGYCPVVCTGRADERSAAPIEALVKDGVLEQVSLGPLADRDIATLIRTSLDGSIDPTTMTRLVHLAEGNPLFLREILATGLESGSLTRTAGRWTVDGPLGAGTGLRRLVADRLGTLSDAQQRGLETLALAEPLELALVEGIIDPDSLVDLERRGIVRTTMDGRRSFVELAHPLFADVIRAATPITSRRAGTASLMDAISEAGARRRDDQVRMAVWHLETGHPLESRVLLQAARIANASFDAALGERVAGAAVDAGAGPYGHLALARAVSMQGRIDEAAQIIDEIDLEAAGDDLRTAGLVAWAENLGVRGGHFGTTSKRLLAERETVGAPECRAQIDGLLCLLQSFAGEVRAALSTAQTLLVTPKAPEPQVLAALTITTLLSGWLCDFDSVEASVERALPLADRLRRVAPDTREKLLTSLGNARTYAGRVVEAEQLLREAYEEAARSPVHPFAPYLGSWLADVLSVRGDMHGAAEVARRSMEWSGVRLMAGVRGLAAAIAVVVAGRAGDPQGVEQALAVTQSGPLLVPPPRAWQLRSEAWLQAAQGNYRRAAAMASDAGRQSLEAENQLLASWCLHEAVDFGHPSEAVQLLRSIADQTTSATLDSFASHAEGLEAGDPEALMEVGESFASRGELFFAARCHRQAARLFQQSNDRTHAVRATTTAELLRPASPDLGAWGLETECSGLTPREAEVAALAAAGTPSKEIADRLYVSIRTVDNHLASVYSKLGLHSRGELAVVLGRHESDRIRTGTN